MDRPFIQRMCESYYNDFELGKTHIWSDRNEAVAEMSSEIVKTMENLKLEDMELYESLFDYGRQKQYQIIYGLLGQYMNESFSDEVLESSGLELIEEVSGVTLATIAAIIGIAAYRPLTRARMDIIIGLGKLGQAIGNFAKKHTTSTRVKKAILFSNQDDCLKQCGINSPQEVKRLTVLHTAHNISLGNQQAEQQSKCLAKCYLRTSIEIATTLAGAYKQCIDANSSGDKVDNLSVLLSQSPISACKTFHDQLQNHRSQFEDAINVLYRKGKQTGEWMKQYDDEILSALRGQQGKRPQRPKPQTRKRF